MACLAVDVFRHLSMIFTIIITANFFGYFTYAVINDEWTRFTYLVFAYWILSVILNILNELTKSIFYLSLSFMSILQALVISVGHSNHVGYLVLPYALFVSLSKFVLEIVIIRYKTKQAIIDTLRENSNRTTNQYPAGSPQYAPQSPIQMPTTTVFIVPTNQGYQQPQIVIAQPQVDRYQPILNTIEKTKKSKIEITILRLVAYLFTIGYFEYCGLRFWLDVFEIPEHAFRPLQLLFPIDLILIQLVLIFLVQIIIYRQDVRLIYAIVFLTGCALILFFTGHYINFSILVGYLVIITVIYLCKIYYKKNSN